MKIINLEEVDSTHTYLKNYIMNNSYTKQLCVVTRNQTNGIGSRGNTWNGLEGNLFFSFVLRKEDLPKDLPLQSTSIYFSFVLKKILSEFGSKLWLKWPNDFYLDDKKIGGTITSFSNNLVYCGIGINLNKVSSDFGFLDISIDINDLLNKYFIKLENTSSWQKTLNEYVIEFNRSKKFHVTLDNEKVSLEKAVLNNDGSIQINNKKVFSLR